MAAILVADVVGYSGLMEADEDGTAQRLANCRNLIDAEIAKCDGRLFKAMGDAVLVEFGSPINAVRCAVGVRAGLLTGWARRRAPITHALWFASC
jgi:adenylate cyclase